MARLVRLAWAALAVVLTLGLTACAPGRVMEAADILKDVAAAGRPSILKAETPRPLRRAVMIPVRDGTIAADLYEPGETVSAGMVLVPGAARQGSRDPRVVAFAETLARARFRVLVPDLPGLRTFRFGSDDAVPIAAALRDLEGRIGDRPVGVTAVSFAVGPAVLAMLETDAADFAVLIGGYHDITEAITWVTTGHWRTAPGHPWQKGDPSGVAKWAFVRANVHRLSSAADRNALKAIAERRMSGARTTEGAPGAGASMLGPEGRAVLNLMENGDPERVPDLIAALPPAIRAEIAALDLARRDLGRLDAAFVLIHGRDDPILPASGSIALAAALPRADLYIVDALRHVEAAGPGLSDSLTLLRATYRVLSLRDGT